MIHTFRRPMTEEERTAAKRVLNAYTPIRAGVPSALAMGVFTAILCGVACLLLSRLGYPVTGNVILATTMAGFVFGAIAGWSQENTSSAHAVKERGRWGQILEQGEMEITRVAAHEAVCVEDEDRSWGGYFLAIGDGKVLFLEDEEYLYEFAECEPVRFPCPAFDLIRFPGTEWVHRMECYGPAFALTRTVVLKSEEFGYIPGDGEVITATLATLEEDLRRYAEQNPNK